MKNLTKNEIEYLKESVLSSILLGYEVKTGESVLKKLNEELFLRQNNPEPTLSDDNYIEYERHL